MKNFKGSRTLLGQNSEIVTRLNEPRFDTRQEQRISLFSKMSRAAQQPKKSPSRWVQPLLSPGTKRQERETAHPPPTGTEILDEWSHNLLLLCAFMACPGTTVPLRPAHRCGLGTNSLLLKGTS